jgi:FAD/FMN-containing dehydrogenase
MAKALAVQAVLGDGTIVRHAPSRSRPAFLHRLWAGAEGTLGIITSDAARLHQPETRLLCLCLSNFRVGFEAVVAMYRPGVRPALLDYGSDTDWAPP